MKNKDRRRVASAGGLFFLTPILSQGTEGETPLEDQKMKAIPALKPSNRRNMSS